GATLEAGGRGASERSLSEDRDGLTRSVTLTAAGEELDFSWRFPKREQYRFAAIGDSGGGSELEWVLRRAADLGADFLIHLGDIYYEKGDFERASRNLNAASIPTYAAIGNHDFHQGWRVLYPRFHRLVGPGNSKFRLGGIEFVNVDTAADFIPAARGRRARILEGLTPIDGNADVRDRVAFTHTPLADPDPERHHAVGRAAEARWLRERFLAAGTRHLLAGHIHIKAELDDQGLYTYITGQGLGHADLIGPEAYRSFAEILVGEVEPGEPVRYRWQPLEMPFEAHCSARNLRMFEVLDRPDVKARLMRACGKS
ncbi:MAG TPA: metallophosphoesterase, partial [Arenicellales bacterium]|nr:metallophosphoesterase [Arenicellales bacterium]